TGILSIKGYLEICSFGGSDDFGSATLGFGSNPDHDATVVLHTGASMSLTGSFTQSDQSVGGLVGEAKSQIKMDDTAILEVCGTMFQNSTTYPLIDYIGEGVKPAYVINKSEVAGADGQISNSSQINWITMSSVSFLNPGDAQYCGENATEGNCNLWPEGLTDNWDSGECHQAGMMDFDLPSFDLVKEGLFN